MLQCHQDLVVRMDNEILTLCDQNELEERICRSSIDNGAQSRKSIKRIGVSRTPSRPARFDHGGL